MHERARQYKEHEMGKEPTDRNTGQGVPDDAVKNPKGANPAHPLPAANSGPDTEAAHVKADAEIEDRFEATDN